MPPGLWAAIVVIVGVVVVSAAVVAYVLLTRGLDARAGLADARAALVRPDPAAARNAFRRARESFSSVDARLSSPVALPLRILPIVRSQVEAMSRLARAGALAADAGSVASAAMERGPVGGWGLVNGRVDTAAAARVADRLREADELGDASLAALGPHRPGWLLGPVASAWDDGKQRLTSAVTGLKQARIGLEAIPSLLGADETRRYVVAFANLAELRGTGGFIGYFTTVEARAGQIRLLAESGRPTEALPPLSTIPLRVPDWFKKAHGLYRATSLWQNINTSADFPTVGSAIAQAVAPTLGRVDGVIQIDADGLAALLDVAGPVRVRLWPTPVTAENVGEITQHGQYVTYADHATRSGLLGDLITTVFQKVLRSRLLLNTQTLARLGAAAAGGNVQAYSVHEADEVALKALGVAGAVDRVPTATDSLAVVTENAAANKADWFLHRTVRYDVSLDPRTDSATTRLTAAFTNRAPATGEPRYVIGPNAPEFSAGENKQIVMVIRPPDEELANFSVTGGTPSVARAPESGRSAYHSAVSMRALATSQLTAEFIVPNALRGNARRLIYRLHVARQPVVNSDFYDVRITPPKGWDVEGATRFVGPLERDLVLEVALHKSLRSRVVDVVFAGPWRAARDLLGGIF